MKETVIAFYVKKYGIIKNTEELDLSFIPSMLHRRMSLLDKIALSNINRNFTEDVQNLVFSSQYGEIERLIKLISQYTENKEVSPNLFSGSVHNYAMGFFLLNKQKSIPYISLSSCNDSISIGLLTSVISDYDNTLFCYADFNDGSAKSLVLNLTKTSVETAVKYILKLNTNNTANDTFENYIRLFSGEIDSIKTRNYIIERMNND